MKNLATLALFSTLASDVFAHARVYTTLPEIGAVNVKAPAIKAGDDQAEQPLAASVGMETVGILAVPAVVAMRSSVLILPN